MDTARYENILHERKREILGRLVKIDTDLGRTRDPDSEERATESENDEVLEGLGQAGDAELKAIDAALERIAKGTFGICAKCGAAIAPERLAVVPHAPLCQDCARGN